MISFQSSGRRNRFNYPRKDCFGQLNKNRHGHPVKKSFRLDTTNTLCRRSRAEVSSNDRAPMSLPVIVTRNLSITRLEFLEHVTHRGVASTRAHCPPSPPIHGTRRQRHVIDERSSINVRAPRVDIVSRTPTRKTRAGAAKRKETGFISDIIML